MNKKPLSIFKNKKGYSMVELMIYLALLITVSVLVVDNIISLFKNYSIVKSNQEIEYNAINILDKLTRDTRRSKNVILNQSSFEIPQGAVALNTASNTIKFYLEDNKIKYMQDGNFVDNLSTKSVTVNNFKIYYISSTSTEAIRVELGLNIKSLYKNFYTTIQLRE